MCKTLDVTRQTCGRYVVETCLRPDGAVFLRTPEIFPVNARNWHGPYENMNAAITDFLDRTAIPKITRKKLSSLRDHGYAGDVGGKEMILHLDRWTGATTLSDFELVEESTQT
ncbi:MULTISPECIES: hypothetical protein [Acetobacter]|uniref:Uncharacterized protein n=1 Tax=Acetobacter indonesiensis TaxID=104101 RepID=A0A6N3T3Z0_9PROT|nr:MULTISPECIES: hypothetical protein [Acetobacter]GAN63245.1 hypothetical protein Abin_024_030 [Acetobacter indonesiensis]GBQ61720.1 hypothetical protein AA0313_2792 [Acetobacter indonesiensis NRIC 0313]GEN03926.1 hypothetical protein AIN02nite_19510 [Acetobacter indonesiensis]